MNILARRLSLFLALGLTILLSSFPASAQSKQKGAGKPRVSSAHPVAIKEIDLEALKGVLKRENARPLLVNFWATWCDPCREEFPDLVKIDGEFRPKGLDFIAISLDEPSELKVGIPKFLSEMRAKMPAYLLTYSDPEPAIKYVDPTWNGGLPATLLYNEKGEIVFKHFGRVNTEELRAAIKKVMSARY